MTGLHRKSIFMLTLSPLCTIVQSNFRTRNNNASYLRCLTFHFICFTCQRNYFCCPCNIISSTQVFLPSNRCAFYTVSDCSTHKKFDQECSQLLLTYHPQTKGSAEVMNVFPSARHNKIVQLLNYKRLDSPANRLFLYPSKRKPVSIVNFMKNLLVWFVFKTFDKGSLMLILVGHW